MKLKKIECPFKPEVMVWVISTDCFSAKGEDDIGQAMFEALTPDERKSVFAASLWYREHYQEWDRKTYQ